MNPERRKVGVIGAGGLVGRALMALPEKADRTIVAYSRSAYPSQAGCSVVWKRLGDPNAVQTVSNWISAAPIWGLSAYFDFLERCGATRLAVLSSNSADVKSASADPAERNLAVRLKQAEEEIAFWAKARGIAYTILRPVMIYGMGLDKNISAIGRFISRFGFFPLAGRAEGLRQPVHACDVAGAGLSALTADAAAGRLYTISGGECLAYRDMVARVFHALGKSPRFLSFPVVVLKAAVKAAARSGLMRGYSPAMIDRMNDDLSCGHADARRDLGFSPRPFHLGPEDLPPEIRPGGKVKG